MGSKSSVPARLKEPTGLSPKTTCVVVAERWLSSRQMVQLGPLFKILAESQLTWLDLARLVDANDQLRYARHSLHP